MSMILKFREELAEPRNLTPNGSKIWLHRTSFLRKVEISRTIILSRNLYKKQPQSKNNSLAIPSAKSRPAVVVLNPVGVATNFPSSIKAVT